VSSPPSPTSTWPARRLDLAAADFPGADLSRTGAPLHFGYCRANSTQGQPFTLTHGIDNWRLDVCR
jgi:hypothetical protein